MFWYDHIHTLVYCHVTSTLPGHILQYMIDNVKDPTCGLCVVRITFTTTMTRIAYPDGLNEVSQSTALLLTKRVLSGPETGDS